MSEQGWLAVLLAATALATIDPQLPIGRFAVDEVSGIVASRRHPGWFWAIRDSGPGRRETLLALRPGRPGIRSLPVAGARNIDWEEITTDDRGDLWIADTGNNAEGRRDLKLLRLTEPDPRRDGAARVAAVHPFAYPDKPPWGSSFDAEALFFLDGAAYIVAKTAGHPVYRFPRLVAGLPVVLERVGKLAEPPRGFDGLVSGAAISRDGRRLAVVTGRRRVWVYAAAAAGLRGDALVRDMIGRPPRWSAPFAADEAAWQVEAVSFGTAGYDLVMAAEEGPIWRFPRAFYEGWQ